MADGNIVERLNQIRDLVDDCLSELGSKQAKKHSTKSSPPTRLTTTSKLDFSLNERAFVKKYARSLSGMKRFVLLVAYLAKGKHGAEVSLKDVQKNWNKMKGADLLGGRFNTKYSTTAKDTGWVNSPRYAVYTLQPSWVEVLEDDE
jgi:hypothetical protein